MLKKYRILITITLSMLFYIFLTPGTISVPVEAQAIPSGVAIDLQSDQKGASLYDLSFDIYTFNKKDEVNHITVNGTGSNIPATRQTRQLKSNHKLIYGLIKTTIMSERAAKAGIGPILDILLNNEFTHDMGWMVVCQGKASEVLTHKVSDYPTTTDFIEGMLESSKNQNFFSDNYKIIDAYVRVDAEGRSLVLPYLELKDNQLQITGSTLFKKDKMVRKLNVDETRQMNFLRETNVQGTLTLEEGFNKVISLYGEVKRKVSCKKISDTKYVFYLDLDYTGSVINNTFNDKFLAGPELIKEFEQRLARQTEKVCNDFIGKMQAEYQVDCLELGRIAAAQYGRGTGVDWDEVVSNSDIRVQVHVQVDRLGRGQYTVK